MAKMPLFQTKSRKEAKTLLDENPEAIVIWESEEHGRTFVLLSSQNFELAKKMARKLTTLMVDSMPERWCAIVRKSPPEKVIARLKRLGYV